MELSLPQLLWYGNTTLKIELPDDWQVELCPMRGGRRAPLTIEQMKFALQNPIGSPPIKELARWKRNAVIIFDDMTRPTRASEIAPLIVRELVAGGISEEDISFVCALGTHGALTLNELRKKIGAEILKGFRVYNHNPYENCVVVGTTSRGTKLSINREVMEADLKIGIGCVTAHAQVGFSGGGKLILPGVAHIDSIAHYHLEVQAQAPETTGLGNFDRNVLRFNIEEAAQMAQLDFKVDVIVNGRGATTAVFAGHFLEAHERAVELAKDVYATEPRPRNKDIAIANAFVKANEMGISILLGALALENAAGTLVIIANAPEGQVVHYLLGRFGRNFGGRQYPITPIPEGLNIIAVSPYMERTFADWFSNPEVVTLTSRWDQALDLLKGSFGSGARVAVIPDATVQYYDS